MPGREIVWLPGALLDIERLYQFLESADPDAAVRSIRSIRSAAETLLAFPERGRVFEAEPKFREIFARFGQGAYVIRYRVDGERIVIVRVWHGRETR